MKLKKMIIYNLTESPLWCRIGIFISISILFCLSFINCITDNEPNLVNIIPASIVFLIAVIHLISIISTLLKQFKK